MQVFHLRTSKHWLLFFVTRWWRQNDHPFCFLSVQKPVVKSYGAPCREVQRRAWLWKWGTGWLDRQAENLQTAAWTATAQKESEWCWLGRGLRALLETFSSTSFSVLSPKLTHMPYSTILTFTGWFAVKKTFAYLPLRNVTYLAFYINGNRFGDKVFQFKGKMLKCDCHK